MERCYPVIVTIGDGVSSTASALIVTVRATRVGFGVDSDGDGFSDIAELATGSDPADPNSHVLGKPLDDSSVGALVLSKTQIKLNFAKANNDSVKIDGLLALPSGFNASNVTLLIDVGGIAKKLTLNARGQAKLGNDSFQLRPVKRGLAAPAAAKFSLSFSKGAFAGMLDASSGLSNADLAPVQRNVAISLAFGTGVQQKTQVLSYSAKKGKSGVASE